MALRKDAKAMVLLTTSAFSVAAAAFAVQIALARTLGAQQYGSFASALALVNMIAPAVAFGLPSFWLKVYGAEGWQAKRWIPRSIDFANLTGLLCVTAAVLWAWIFADSVTGTLIIWMLPVVLTQGAMELASARFQLEERHGSMALWLAVQHLARLALVIGCGLGHHEGVTVAIGFGLIGLLVTIGARTAITPLLRGTARLAGHIDPATFAACEASIARPSLIEVVRGAGAFGIGNVLYFTYMQSGTYIVGQFAGPGEAAFFGIAATIYAAVYLAPMVLYQRLLMPRFHRWAAVDDRRLIGSMRQGIPWMLASGMLTAVAILLLAKFAVPLAFGRAFAPAVPVVMTMAVCAPLRFASRCAYAVLNTGKRLRVSNICMTIVLLFSVVTTCTLAKTHGAMGAAWAAVAAEALMTSLGFLAAFRCASTRGAAPVSRLERAPERIANSEFAAVSVILPCYNCEDSIERAVASIHRQSLPPREVILVDDCSTDGTRERLQAIREVYGDDWIRVVLRETNGGPGSARNEGWRAASQPYIAFLDSDDSWHPRKMELQYCWMIRNPDVAITGHPVDQKNANTATEESLTFDAIDAPEPVTRNNVLFANRFTPSSIVVRADVQARFDETKKYAEDYYFLLTLVLVEERKAYLFANSLSYVFKRRFGADTGLSARLWKIQQGEQDNYRRLRQSGVISHAEWLVFAFLSALKYLRRCVLSRRFA